jgi:hypothetical protein
MANPDVPQKGTPKSWVAPPPPRREGSLNVEALHARWRAALDAAGSALRAAAGYLSRTELREARSRIVSERAAVLGLLGAYARDGGTSAQVRPCGTQWRGR